MTDDAAAAMRQVDDALSGDPEDQYTKLSVLLTQGSMDALGRARDVTGDSRTDVVNRALHLYAYMVTAKVGDVINFDRTANGDRRSVTVLQ